MSKRYTHSGPSGVLIVDKPSGVTSHDVVAQVRRVLGTRRVGHAGTLDPMATGVLVVMVGQGTKLAPYLTSNDKRYQGTVKLGVGTDTLDAEGQVSARAPLPDWWYDDEQATQRIDSALANEQSRTEQLPPVFSAIKIAGKSAHKRARAGEQIELAPRPVCVRSLRATARAVEQGTVTLELEVSKGYYVRSLARDLGATLAVPAHLCALRRTASGPFSLQRACAADDAALSNPAAMLALELAVGLALPTAQLTSEGAERAGCGGAMQGSDFEIAPPAEATSAWLTPDKRLVAIGGWRGGRPAVLRGFSDQE